MQQVSRTNLGKGKKIVLSLSLSLLMIFSTTNLAFSIEFSADQNITNSNYYYPYFAQFRPIGGFSDYVTVSTLNVSDTYSDVQSVNFGGGVEIHTNSQTIVAPSTTSFDFSTFSYGFGGYNNGIYDLVFTDVITDQTDSSSITLSTLETIYVNPIPATLPLFATGLGALGLLGWLRKRKAQAAA